MLYKQTSSNSKMLVGYFFVIFMSHIVTVDVEGIEILEALLHPIIDFKESLLNGVFGKGKCGCPCRTYWVPKCEIAYVQQCHYDHYQNQVCNTVPVPQNRPAKETECQRCRKYAVPTPTTKWAIECNPVYDEKCKTSYPQHCKVEQRCHQLYQTVCQDSAYGYGGQTCDSVPREHCYPETKCHRTPMTQCRPVQKEKCVKVPREVIVQKEEKQCLPFEISQAEIDAQANSDPCGQQGFDLGGQAGAGNDGHAQIAVGSHHSHGNHAHQQPVSNGYDVGTHQQQHQQQAVGGYQVANTFDPHHGSQHGHAHGQQQSVSNGYDVGSHQQQHQQQAVGGYQVANTLDPHHGAQHGNNHGQAKNLGLSNIPVQNLYTVDAYASTVPGGVLLNEPLPSNHYYGGRIGERREAPLGSHSQHQYPQQQPFELQMHQNQVNVAVLPDPIFGFQQNGYTQHNQKRQLNPANKSKNPFLRKRKRFEGGAEKKRQRSLGKESIHATSSKPIRFEKTNTQQSNDVDIETNTINDSVSSLPSRKRIHIKKEKDLAKGRFTADSYQGWTPILYPVEG